MQLILDAGDIHIKGNMSTVEQESLNEKFLTNKIIDHLADDITSGNKENIQKQDNIIPDLSENDSTESNKDTTADHVISNNLIEENSNESTANIENVENLEDVECEINSRATEPQTVHDNLIVENTNEEESQEKDVILSKELNANDDQESGKENVSNIISDNNSTIDEYSAQKEDDGVELIFKENQNTQVVEDEATVKLTTIDNEEKEVGLDEHNAVKVTTKANEENLTKTPEEALVQIATAKKEENEKDVDEIKEETKVNTDGDESVKVTPEEHEEKQVDINEDFTLNVTTQEQKEEELSIDGDKAVQAKSEEDEEKQRDVDEDAVIKEITEVKEENVVEVMKNDAVEVTSEDNKEKQVDVNEDNAVEVTTEQLNLKENQADVNLAIDNITGELENIDQNIPNTKLDDKQKKMESSIIETIQTDSMNGNNSPIEIDDEDEKSIEKNDSPNAEILALDENMEVEELNETMEVQELDENMEHQELDENTQGKVISIQEPESPKEDTTAVKAAVEVTEPKRICKLSNNLDIFSDEEEDSPERLEPPKDDIPPATETKQCINIDEDDDIMLIDEDTNAKSNKIEESIEDTASDNIEPLIENTINENVCTESVQVAETVEVAVVTDTIPPDNADVLKNTVPETSASPDVQSKETHEVPSDKVEDKKINKPLLPKHFIKTCKKNLADMTREDLEEFCVLKIVESIVDRCNLGEIKSQLKNLTQAMDDCKKKCFLLSKQNKDLQVVLKSVQEEQKSVPDVHVSPLKITRSVGMQVVMGVEKPISRKKSTNGVCSPGPSVGSYTNTKQTKSLPNRSNKEKNTNNQQIPVPRLVPAVSVVKTNQSAANNIAAKLNNVIISNVPNGLRNSPPAQKITEKRPRAQSVTVDLTDDEPPPKMPNMQRGVVNQTMRIAGTPPTIIPTQRFSAANMNSPRKVYIPISGAQAQNVRPGQTIMLKTVSTTAPRQRYPTPHVAKIPQSVNQVRTGRPQANKHPAPLPDAVKQYQPPNWKALPPSPEIKLSKVENGIVISWKIDTYLENTHEEIASYQLYAYQETTAPPSTSLWKKIGDVKALALPMACTLTQFMSGYKYYFAVRAVDVRSRLGAFSLPGSILLLNKM